MRQQHLPSNPAAADAPTHFAGRPPSQSWEMIPFADAPQSFFWVWFKPANAPDGLVLRIPDETYRTYPHRDQLTMRKLLLAAGIEPDCVSTWQLNGAAYDAQNGVSPYWDQPVPEPAAGGDPNIIVCVKPQDAAQPVTATPVSQEHEISDILANMESDWIAAQRLEKQLAIVRKQLVDMQARLNSLNRDLSPEERLFADKQDLTEWQDARRWMRDVAAKLARYIKDFDVGEMHSVVKKDWFTQTYRRFIVPRQPFEGMQLAQREFESYRKMVQVLLTNMNNAYAKAAQDGERRARQVLSRIAAKLRSARNRG